MVYDSLRKLVPSKKCLKEKNNGDFLIVSSFNLDIYYLNDTAKEFYILIDGNRNIETITNDIASMYDVQLNILYRDISYLVRDLQWKRLIILN